MNFLKFIILQHEHLPQTDQFIANPICFETYVTPPRKHKTMT